MDIKQFMESKSISDSPTVENNSDKRFQKWVLFNQHRKMRAANIVADSSSPFQTSPVATGGFDGLSSPKQSSKPPNW